MLENVILLREAVGRIEAGPDQQSRLDELTSRLQNGDFFVPVTERIATRCIDGRPGARGVAPNAAGGSETLMVADDLTFKRFGAPSTLEAYSNVLNALQTAGLPLGGHTDDHAKDAASGCGANDRLEAIYDFIATRGDVVRATAATLGIAPSDETHALIVQNARARTEFSPGSELLTVLRTAGGDEVVDPLEGEHKEVVAVINSARGTTLDRAALAREFGPDYQAFNADVWSFSEGAAFLAEDEQRIAALVAAQVYYNLATAYVLCGPRMRVIVR